VPPAAILAHKFEKLRGAGPAGAVPGVAEGTQGAVHCVQDATPELERLPEALARVLPTNTNVICAGPIDGCFFL
jgi:hypothetical protein